MTHIAEKIRQALQEGLPGSMAHARMLPPNRELKVAEVDRGKIKTSSVMLLLYEAEGKVYACLIKRTQHMKFHPGQIALPGGRIEKGETALDTALRETREEIGILEDDIDVLGSLSEVYVSVSRFVIQPFVGWIKQNPVFTLNHHEVVKVIRFPLFEFRNLIEKREIRTSDGIMAVPCIPFEGEIIWGATAMILSEFLEITDF